MPPAKSIFVNTDTILANVARIAARQASDVVAKYRQPEYRGLDYFMKQDRERANWVPRDLEQLTGKSLTPSERIRTQQAVRKLEADGLVRLSPRWVRLTPAGTKHVAALQQPEGVGDG